MDELLLSSPHYSIYEDPYPIWFIVYADSVQADPEKVTAHSRQDIDDLKNLISARRQDIPATDMLLWKVRLPYGLLQELGADSA
jgi:hypothetical protein